jgi:hypothetical protein
MADSIPNREDWSNWTFHDFPTAHRQYKKMKYPFVWRIKRENEGKKKKRIYISRNSGEDPYRLQSNNPVSPSLHSNRFASIIKWVEHRKNIYIYLSLSTYPNVISSPAELDGCQFLMRFRTPIKITRDFSPRKFKNCRKWNLFFCFFRNSIQLFLSF